MDDDHDVAFDAVHADPARRYAKRQAVLLALLPLLAASVAARTLAGADTFELAVAAPLVTVSADFDADGRSDIAVLSIEPPLVSVFRSEADRTLTPLATLEPGFSSETLFAGDLDQDGAAELVVGNYAGRFVLVAWNDGSGGFRETVELFVGVPPRALALLDEGDSLELAAAGGERGEVAIVEARRDRRFGPPEVVDSPVELPHILTASDLNGDGRLDLAVWGRSSSPFLAVLEREAAGGFAVTSVRSALLDPGDFTAPVVTAADVDGDGVGDLLALVRESPLGGVGVGVLYRIRRTPGSFDVARWGLEIPLERATALLPLARSAGDPDDVALVGATAGGGLFAAMPNPDSPGGRDRPCALEIADLPRVGVGVVSSGDFDGDGNLDVAVPLERRDAITVLYAPEMRCAEAETCYLASPALEPGIAGPLFLAFESFEPAPGGVLAVVGDAGGMLLRPAAGGFARGERFPAPPVVRGIAAADLDADGVAEIVLSDFARGALEVVAFAGAEPGSRSFALPPGALPEGVGAGDLDRRGGLDIAVALRGLDAVAVLLAEPDGGFAPPLLFAAGARPRALALGDVDGDGRLDIAVANDGAAAITLLLGAAPGDPPPALFGDPLPLTVAPGPRALALHDLDRNGRDDPVVLSDDGSLTVHGSFADRFRPRVFEVAPGSSPVAFVIEDLDRDGRDDVAVATVTPAAIALFRGDATALLVPDGTIPLPRAENAPTALTLSAADLHVDGLTDIAVGDPLNGALTVLRPLGCAIAAAPLLRRGDSDQSGRLELTDSVRTLNHLFLDAGPLPCPDAADTNDDGKLDLTDAVSALTFLFLSGPEPPAPGAGTCGEDPTEDALAPCEGACGE